MLAQQLGDIVDGSRGQRQAALIDQGDGVTRPLIRRAATRFCDDFQFTQASLHWFTRAISTSFRPYYEYAEGLTKRVGRVTVPTVLPCSRPT